MTDEPDAGERRCYCGRELHPDDATFETGWGGPECPHETLWDVVALPAIFLGLPAVFLGIGYFVRRLAAWRSPL